MRRSTSQWKKGFFSEKGGGNSVNKGFGKDLYSKGNSAKRSRPFSEPPDSENWKVAVLIPFPKISSYWQKKPGTPFLGTTRETKTPFLATFWVAWGGLKWPKSGLKVAYSVPKAAYLKWSKSGFKWLIHLLSFFFCNSLFVSSAILGVFFFSQGFGGSLGKE